MSQRSVTIITGASRGIGAATAARFAQAGYDLALVARSEDALRSVAESAAASGVETLVCAGDLADMDFVENVARRAAERWGRIDVLVNNAAWRTVETLRTMTPETWERTLRVSLTAPVFLAKAAAEVMEQGGRGGVILNISSINSQRASGISPAYVSCKGALDSVSYDMASLYGRSGIRVISVCPGWIDTGLSQDYVTPDGQSLGEKISEYASDMVPLGRAGTPEEVAATLVWLASPDASYVTGTRLVIDGGWQQQHFPHSLKRQQFPDQFS